ncbi:Cytohesin-1 [Exaiptasia diaphana]|nr:Cytohesin-1 [Exaiptasia diaphana]
MKTKQRTIGRKKFNLHPNKGIEYLISSGLLNETPEDVADFLYTGENLNKTQIGNYLGENQEFNLKVFDKFVKLHKFEKRDLVHALREFLWSFRLPGEAQKIDRMMEGFAKQYCQDNPGLFTDTDTCYVLSFSIILLNTSLHNPSVKDKGLYESIKNEAFKIPEDDGNDITQTFFNPDREGSLVKEGGLHKTWKKRYFILKDNCLYYFKNVGDREPRGIIPLENLQVREVNDAKKKYCFEIFSADNSSGLIKACKTDSEGKVVEGHHDVYRICAASEEERETWIGCIKASMIFDPFYDMLQTRKKKVTQAAVYS